MPATVALLLWLVLLVALLYWDPAKHPNTSPALWVPVIWMFIVASRLPSQWVGGNLGIAADALQEGNPLDRSISLALIGLAIAILVRRSFNWSAFLRRNPALVCFLLFALVSVCWSDFPYITFKRWFRDLGNYLIVLVALSDRRPLEAVRAVLRRLTYVLISLSILLIRYYPQLGRQYDNWTGAEMYSGATTSKNMLGVVCLVSGLFLLWDTLTRWPQRKQAGMRSILFMNALFGAMTLWLLDLSNSATSRVCLVLGGMIIAASHVRWFKRRPGFLKVLIPVCFCLYVILAFGFNVNGELAGAVGRDPTLTERTKIWATLLGMHTNPLLGTGYQSFWLGSRLEWFWHNSGLGTLNEAHNGYLEVYLDLGLIGVGFLAAFLVAAYRNISRSFTTSSSIAVLTFAVWTALVFYNMTEAAFEGGMLWMLVLMGALAMPARAKKRVPNLAGLETSTSDGLAPVYLEPSTAPR